MTFLFLGIVVAVVLLFLLNPARWRALSKSARSIADDIRHGSEEDDEDTNS
jgi:hypothetical protein